MENIQLNNMHLLTLITNIITTNTTTNEKYGVKNIWNWNWNWKQHIFGVIFFIGATGLLNGRGMC